MFEVGWTEMLVIAIVMIVVVGPKDLPGMLRTFGRTVAKLRSMAGDFQKQFNEALKEAELEDVKKSVDALRGLNPAAEIKKQLNPFEKAADEVRAGLNNALKPKPAADTKPTTDATPAEPLKGGDVEAPAVVPPSETPPQFPAMTDASVAPAPAPEPVKAASVKAAPAKKPASRAAAKAAAPAKATTAKATAAKVGKPDAQKKPVPEKKPAAARRKTAGAAK